MANIYGPNTDKLSPKKEETKVNLQENEEKKKELSLAKEEPIKENAKENFQEIEDKEIEKCENEKEEKEESREIPFEKRLASPIKVLNSNISENKGVKRSADESPLNESFQPKRNNTNSSPKRNPFFKSPPNEISPNLLGWNKFKSNIVIKSRYFNNHTNPPSTRTSLFKKVQKTEEKDDEVAMVPETPTQNEFYEVPETQTPEKLSQSFNGTCIVNETPDNTDEEILVVPETQNESLNQDILLAPETVQTEISIVPETPETDSFNPDILVIPETAQTESSGNEISFK